MQVPSGQTICRELERTIPSASSPCVGSSTPPYSPNPLIEQRIQQNNAQATRHFDAAVASPMSSYASNQTMLKRASPHAHQFCDGSRGQLRGTGIGLTPTANLIRNHSIPVREDMEFLTLSAQNGSIGNETNTDGSQVCFPSMPDANQTAEPNEVYPHRSLVWRERSVQEIEFMLRKWRQMG